MRAPVRGGRVRLTTAWALWGKRAQDSDYGVRSCSGSPLSPYVVQAVMDRFTTGSPEWLPSVTISWFGGGPQAHVGLAIQEWSEDRDRFGRPIALTRYFCVPYEQLRQTPVSYEALYDAFVDVPLPADGPFTVDVPYLDPAIIGERVTAATMATTALLLSRQRVCVVGADEVSLRERLRYIDTVTALLPYGLRAKFSAATWSSSTSGRYVRFAFSSHAPADAEKAVWKFAPPLPSGRGDPAREYVRMLHDHGRPDELVFALSRATEPLGFLDGDLREIFRILDDIGPRAPAARKRTIEKTLLDLANAFSLRDAEPFGAVLADVAVVADASMPGEEERAALLEIVRDHRMLSESQPFPELTGRLFDVLLRLLWRNGLRPEHLPALENAAGALHVDLAEAMLRHPTAAPVVTLTAANILGARRLAQTIRRVRTAELVEAAAGADEPWLVGAACDELATRTQDPELAVALRRRGHLAAELAAAHPGRGDVQLRALVRLLTAAYGPRLTDVEFDEILGRTGVLPPVPLLGAATIMYGEDAGPRLLGVVVPRILRLAGFGRETSEEVVRLLAPQEGERRPER
ncbi:hypothetical protein [Actinoallomurus iriomotensis]|uniref:Uncharacterized protein n=1 Tax=Actinoallomurus iriomotensis TaxID=478107 RepID=A0A9W6RX06_9ACTN|nr:hypothetical protein [Actinoallomurus iriomotensis]GLY83326.1 hypothetical protein Airi02_012560 [Actinoallomurus iriomotensis]